MVYDNEALTRIKKHLGVDWDNPAHLVEALTHSSYAHENKHLNLTHNQRLEFLGDAVLELVISNYLFNKYCDYPEGVLTKIRAGIVCEPSLASVAQSLKLGEFLLIGRGEERSGGRKRPSILADALEALIGAIYLDQGMERATYFIIDVLDPVIQTVIQNGGLNTDFKTQLQELVQKNSENTLKYRIIDESGPDHSKTFKSAVSFEGLQWGSGTGRTKKEAEQAAAKDALTKIASGDIKFSHGEYNE